MVNKLCTGIILSCVALPAFADDYADFKTWLKQDTGLTYSVQLSTMPQYGRQTSWQNMYHGNTNWQATKNFSVQAAYTGTKYFGRNATAVSNDMGVAVPINDYPENSNSFDRFSATYALDRLSLTIGQFPIYAFDGGRYNSNQQINFNNYSLAQDATQLYPVAGLGAYLTFTPTDMWSFAVGAQDATNLSGHTITTSGFDQKKVNGFAYASYKPKYGQYNLLVYYQPSVDAQPEDTWGWSFNALRNFGKIGVFMAANGTTARLQNVQQSYAVGTVYNNPFGRNTSDQIGLAYALNKLNTEMTERSVESVFEIYYDFSITKYFVLTPDFQFYLNPGNDDSKRIAAAATLRVTASF